MKKFQTNQLLFILILLLGGIVVGVIGSHFLELETLNRLDLILLPMNETLNTYDTFISQFSMQALFIAVIAVLGTSLFGTFLIAFVLFTKGFQIGLTCMMFIYTYHMKGILGILLALLPTVLLEMIPVFIISIYAIECSNHVLYTCLSQIKFRVAAEINKCLNYLIVSFLSALAASYLKATLIIMLIRFFNSF